MLPKPLMSTSGSGSDAKPGIYTLQNQYNQISDSDEQVEKLADHWKIQKSRRCYQLENS